MDIKKVAFIGTGIMGCPMAGHLIDAGYELSVYNHTPEKAQPLVDKGATLAPSAAEAARGADVVFTMVGFPEQVEELYLAKDGLISSVKNGAYLIDMTTSSPQLARDIHELAEVSGVHAFDAPVTGGEDGAKAATLTIFCGADAQAVEPVMGLLKAMGTLVLTFDRAGQGQMAKLANQVALASSMLGLVEALTFAKQGGLDADKVLGALLTGTAASSAMRALGPKILREDYKPGFMVEHFMKDLNLALSTAEDEEVTLPATETAAQLYSMLAEIGGARMGTQALSLVYADEGSCAQAGLDWSVLNIDEDDEAAEAVEAAIAECDCGHDHGARAGAAGSHGHAHDGTCDCGCDCDECDGDCGCGCDCEDHAGHGHDGDCTCGHGHGDACDCDEDGDEEETPADRLRGFEAPFSQN